MEEEKTKQCSRCLTTLDFTYFSKDKHNKFGLSSHCKFCKSDGAKQRRLQRKEITIKIASHKKCIRCKETKIADNFSKLRTNIDGLCDYCKLCYSLIRKERKIKAKTNIIIADDDIIKKCFTCYKDKKLSEFRVNRKSDDNFYNICIECSPKNNWTVEKQRVSETKYRTNNPEKMKAKYKKQSLQINRNVRSCLNKRINEALKAHNVKKKNKTIEYIGCSIDFFKGWIQHLFQTEMSWDNHGLWHYDHVKPCVAFDLSVPEQVKECFNWKNYQPLWGIDNLIKNGRVDNELIKTHLEKANNYERSISNILSAQVKEGELLE
jgi:hypothetical protein